MRYGGKWLDRLYRFSLAAGFAACAVVCSGCFEPEQVLVEDIYIVRPGDTLWDISEEFLAKNTGGRRYILEFKASIEELNPWLRKQGGLVYPDQVLRINYFVRKEEAGVYCYRPGGRERGCGLSEGAGRAGMPGE